MADKKTEKDKLLEQWRKEQKSMAKIEYIIKAINDYMEEKSYSHKPHLQNLPYDLNTNDPKKLKERLKACNRELRDAQSELKNNKEMGAMIEDNIKEYEDTINNLKETNKELIKENKEVFAKVEEINNHFEDVSILSEDDGWKIKKQYDKVKETSDADFSDIEDNMIEFIDEVSLLGYLPDTYPKDDRIYPTRYIDDKLNPMIDRLKQVDSPEAQKLASQMEDYRDKYNVGADTPLSRELDEISSGISDIYDVEVNRNNQEIEKHNQTIENIDGKLNGEDGLYDRQKLVNHNIRTGETKVNDLKEHKEKIKEKIDKVENT